MVGWAKARLQVIGSAALAGGKGVPAKLQPVRWPEATWLTRWSSHTTPLDLTLAGVLERPSLSG